MIQPGEEVSDAHGVMDEGKKALKAVVWNERPHFRGNETFCDALEHQIGENDSNEKRVGVTVGSLTRGTGRFLCRVFPAIATGWQVERTRYIAIEENELVNGERDENRKKDNR